MVLFYLDKKVKNFYLDKNIEEFSYMNKNLKTLFVTLLLSGGIFAYAQNTVPIFDDKDPAEKIENDKESAEPSADSADEPTSPSTSSDSLPYADKPLAELKSIEKMRLKLEIRRRLSEKSKEIEMLIERLVELDDPKTEEFLAKEFGFLSGFDLVETSPSKNTKKTASASSKKNEAPSDIEMPIETEKGLVDAKRSILIVGLGGRGVGTAFVAQIKGKPFIVTNVHVIETSANLTFSTISGENIPMPKICFIGDGRDLAIMPLDKVPEGIVPMPFSDDFMNDVKENDEIMICGNSMGKDVLLSSKGKLLAIGPNRIEIDASIFPGNSGGPVYHSKTKKIIGVVSFVTFDNTNNPVYKSSMQKSNSPIKNQARYFCVRGDLVKTWEKYNVSDVVAQGAIFDTAEKKLSAIATVLDSNGMRRLTNYPYPELDRIVKEWADLYRSLGNSSGALMEARKNLYSQLARLSLMEGMKVNKAKANDYYKERQKFLHEAFIYLKDMATNLAKI